MTATVEHEVADRTPEHWPRVQLRRLATIKNGGTPTSEAENWDGDVPFVTPPDLRRYLGRIVAETGRTLTLQGAASGSTLTEGGVIVSTRAPIGYVARLEGRSAFNQGCRVLETHGVEDRFLTYSLLSQVPVLQEFGQGATFMELSSESLASLQIAAPSGRLQVMIADYLDRETAKISALIGKQVDLILTLHERKRAVLDSVEYSQVKRVRLAHIVSSIPGLAFPSSGFLPAEEGVRLLRGINVKPGTVDWGDAVSWLPQECHELHKYRLRKNDVVLGLDRPFIGAGTRVALIAAEDSGALLVQRVLKMTAGPLILPEFLYYLLSGRKFREYAEVLFTGVSVPHLSESQVLGFDVPVPSMDQQRKLVDGIRASLAKINVLISKSERLIELSQERRAALITAAVTGRIDVGRTGGERAAELVGAGTA